MLYEFAITPDVFEKVLKEEVELTSLVDFLYGLTHDGILANPGEGRWMDYIESDIFPFATKNTISDIKSCLNILRDRNRIIISPPRIDEGSSIDWCEVITKSDKKMVLYGILTTFSPFPQREVRRKCIDFPPNPLRSLLWKEYRTNRTVNIQKTEANYRKKLYPLLRFASKVQLIDPYFNCMEERYKIPLNIVAELTACSRFDKNFGLIQIHTTQDVNDHEWKMILQPLANEYSHRLEVHTWRKIPKLRGKERQHDRFILTDQCGVISSYGLDVQETEITRLSILGYEERTLLHREYNLMSKSNRFKYLRCFSVNPS